MPNAVSVSPAHVDKVVVNGVDLLNRKDLSNSQNRELQRYIDENAHLLGFLDKEKGEFEHADCGAHKLNLAVKATISSARLIIEKGLSKCRRIADHFSSSYLAEVRLKVCQLTQRLKEIQSYRTSLLGGTQLLRWWNVFFNRKAQFSSTLLDTILQLKRTISFAANGN